jgi:hypothetical protein
MHGMEAALGYHSHWWLQFKLSDVRKLVIVASVTQEGMIHNKLHRCPHLLADVNRQLCVCLVYIHNHLVMVFAGF